MSYKETTGARFEAVRALYNRFDRESVEGVAFSLPYLVLFTIFILYPVAKGLYMSFFDWNPVVPSQSEFIFLENYIRMFQTPLFWKALRGTVIFVVLTVLPLVALGLGLALGVNYVAKGRRILRAIFFSPYILTVSVVALVWISLLGPSYGPVNYYVGGIVQNPPQWLNSYTFAMPSVAAATIWWVNGFNFVIFLAARQNVPDRLYEAAKLDGARNWRMFRDITLPQMRESILFVMIVQFIFQFQIFGQVYIMTGGGPGNSTMTLVLYLYRAAFQSHNFGYAAAVGYFLFAVLVAVSLVNYRFIGGDGDE
ncbi:sugar ABC transporter permease [halophilic archaeon]|nr:sugar ABC transporter permease [halophilic archaeon]